MRISRLLTLFKWACAAGIVLVVAALVLLPKRTGTEGFTVRAAAVPMKVTTDAALRTAFADPQAGVPRAAYEQLMRYAFEGFAHYRTDTGASAHYPGMHSTNGRRADGIEGFARVFPIAGVWLGTGHPDAIDVGGQSLSLSAAFTQGVLAGTDPKSPGYWGPVNDYGQRIVESSDIALGLWTSREQIWNRLDAAQRRQVADWLIRAVEVETFDGNWELFPTVVHRVLKALGVDTRRVDERMVTRWQHFKSSYRGDGWFWDPPNGFDYYNAWSIHYQMFWLDQIAPDFDPAFIRKTNAELVGLFKYLFGPRGFPMMGRSSCYRMAAPTPLVTATWLSPQAVSPGEAMRAMDLTWGWFVQHGALADGVVTQGFCGVNPEILGDYSGPASCLWAYRSLIAATWLDGRVKLFDAARTRLPVEQGDFSVASATPGWTVTGNKATGDVTITIPGNAEGPGPAIKPYGIARRIGEWVLEKQMRPDNRPALYQRRQYSTADPVVACRP